MSDAARGCFVVLEGLDGAGKTTQAARLATRLSAAGVPVNACNQPSSGSVGALIRRALAGECEAMSREALALLFAADRVQQGRIAIEPALRAGCWVVGDRHVESSVAYQADPPGTDDELSAVWVRGVNARALVPDLTILLDVDLAEARRRLAARGRPADALERDAVRMEAAASHYAWLGRQASVGGGRIAWVDGARAPEQVEADVWEAVERHGLVARVASRRGA